MDEWRASALKRAPASPSGGEDIAAQLATQRLGIAAAARDQDFLRAHELQQQARTLEQLQETRREAALQQAQKADDWRKNLLKAASQRASPRHAHSASPARQSPRLPQLPGGGPRTLLGANLSERLAAGGAESEVRKHAR